MYIATVSIFDDSVLHLLSRTTGLKEILKVFKRYKKFTWSVVLFGGTISNVAFYGLISTIVPFGANLSISSISSSVTAIHPLVQSTSL